MGNLVDKTGFEITNNEIIADEGTLEKWLYHVPMSSMRSTR